MLVPIADAAGWFPKRGNRPLGSKAIRKRITTGIRGVRLEARRDGREWFTCREWVERFLEELTAASLSPAPVPAHVKTVRTPDRVKRLLERRFGIHGAK